MKILYLTHRLPYAPNRGDRIRAFHVLRRLARDHDVHVISLVHDREEARHVDDVRALGVRVDCASVPRQRNYLRGMLAMATRKPLTHVLLSSPEFPSLIHSAVRESNPDLVLAYCTGIAHYAAQEPLRQLPLVLDMVDVDSEKWRQLSERAAPPMRWIYRREHVALREFERSIASTAVATTLVTERERQLFLAGGGNADALVVPNGVDVDRFSPVGPPSASAEVVFAGVFDYAPNVEGALWFAERVWPLVVQQNPSARLTLLGMNPVRSVAALSSPTITVTGSVADVRPFLWRAAVSVAPLRVARGVQNKVLEALAAGLPCVVSPSVFDGLPDQVRPGCTRSSGAAEFAESVLALLAMSGEDRRVQASRADLSSLTWEHQLSRFATVLESARNTSRHRSSPTGTGQTVHPLKGWS